MMKLSLYSLLFVFGLCRLVDADDIFIRRDQKIDEVSNQMIAAKYKRTCLDMISKLHDTELQFWSVEQGVLIVGYSTSSKKVTSLSFLVNHRGENKEEQHRNSTSFNVTEFAPLTGEMKLKLRRRVEAEKGKD